jgi:threonyl-tRNA synthetase
MEKGMDAKEKRRPSEFTRFVLADLQGKTYDVTPEDYAGCELFAQKESQYALMKQFVANELSVRTSPRSLPRHIEYMQSHDLLDYCEVSERGHYSWFPKGVLMQKLILDYAVRLASDWGAFEMKNPMIIRGDHNLIGQLMGEFHERDYKVDGGRGPCYLRYASDPLAFPFMQKVRFSHKQSPLRVYEETTCFRNEQEGEVSGLKRVRGFLMTDMHAACADEEEARGEYEYLCVKFADFMNNIIAPERWVLGWEGTLDFFESHREWLVGIGKKMRVPAFFKLMPQMSHYYAIKNEFQFINEDHSNIQVSTVQWDVKDGARFDISYIDENNSRHPCPVIIHASSFGSIERTLCAILENIAIDADNGVTSHFPFWLAPTQVRILPVSDNFIDFARGLAGEISHHGLRADVDDRDASVGKKIRDGEKEWVPFLIVVGEKEVSAGQFSVRSREDHSQIGLTLAEFIELAKSKQGDKPFRPLSLPVLLSRRPLFH